MAQVIWEFSVDTEDPLEAAMQSWIAVRRRNSIANSFDVFGSAGELMRINLQSELESSRLSLRKYLSLAEESVEYYLLLQNERTDARVLGAFDFLAECEREIEEARKKMGVLTAIVLAITAGEMRVHSTQTFKN